ncbi:DUF2147 domain-containing protein [Winogradskyella jejuensis]|uniref:DUF2147 domain-containing protein n=1 Tax=Winogradskyella jejuensis TaxID=1089305 RepID=A0A1M5VLI2_9FLAO|nr:DUF2147 domain-containing protein [Winogradskyella jejuensis]SHH76038.1 hypothetical protein SAMN05444148_2736 [Winogradskyella jejuensis]
MKSGLLIVFLFSLLHLNAQSILGKWKTIDDETGEEKSIVNIYQKDGRIYGDIIELVNNKNPNPLCDLCRGKNKNEPIIGMTIINYMKKEEDIYEGGTILNPSNGKVYKCRLKLETPNKLQVRGYVAFFYKTQYWKRVN